MSNSEKPVKFSFVLKTSRSITLKNTVVTAFVMAFTRWYSQTMILDWDRWCAVAEAFLAVVMRLVLYLHV